MIETFSGAKIQPLVGAGTRLADLLAAENMALAAMDLSGAVALLPAKRKAMAEFANAGPPPMNAPQPHISALGDRLCELVAENRRLLERAMTVQRNVLGILARAVPIAPTLACYGATGASARPTKASPLTLLAQV